MSVLIKGMEMPKTCGDCPIGDTLCCSLMPGVPALWKEYTLALRTNRRHEECPLVPVPPHGRLGDLDALITTFCERGTSLERKGKFVTTMAEAKQTIVDIIEDAPTIIPAEEAPAKDINVPTTYDLLYEEGGAGTT